MSDGVWPDVISGVRVHVRELEEKAILSSASLRLTGNVSTNIDSPGDINTVLILNRLVPAALQVDGCCCDSTLSLPVVSLHDPQNHKSRQYTIYGIIVFQSDSLSQSSSTN